MTPKEKRLRDMGRQMARDGVIGHELDARVKAAGYSRADHTEIRKGFNDEVEIIYR